MAKEKRTARAVEKLEEITSDCAAECPETCSAASDGCGSMSTDCR
ncbi:hypothetical protein P378_14365 [Desulforamulus profundi]|uniref:Six-cysteine peptide SCIFF n=1 Tax=Desulforamulus profundi TaxID=1383067 RepID=A0A2C6MCA4_9FIRM|nr:hypothetical protein [Desulforamulus profundi]PHJ37668.1 hypothetical protein P378_14365 [Desulforamulus profundi]